MSGVDRPPLRRKAVSQCPERTPAKQHAPLARVEETSLVERLLGIVLDVVGDALSRRIAVAKNRASVSGFEEKKEDQVGSPLALAGCGSGARSCFRRRHVEGGVEDLVLVGKELIEVFDASAKFGRKERLAVIPLLCDPEALFQQAEQRLHRG